MPTIETQRPGNSGRALSVPWYRSWALNLLFLAMAVALLFGGSRLIASHASNGIVEQHSAPLTVQTDRLRIQSHYLVPQRFLGRIEPRRQADLGFESGGTIAQIRVEEGEAVLKGDLLASLDKRSLNTRLNEQLALRTAFKAQLELAELSRDRQQGLLRNAAGSEQQFDQARLKAVELEARVANTEATIAGINVALDKSDIRAPFDGHVGMRHSDEGSSVSPGSKVLSVLEQSEPRVRIGLSPVAAASLVTDSDYVIEVQGQRVAATLMRIRPDLDPFTRTVTAIFRLKSEELPFVPFGEIAEISLERAIDANGAWVPISGLSEGSRGMWTLLVIDETNVEPVVQRESVEILYSNERMAYVRGTFIDGTRFVDVGTHRVTVGLPVRMAETDQ